eukprot:5791-Heterococcus_DN1.PRE.2
MFSCRNRTDLSKRAPFLPVVDDDPCPALLRCPDALLNGMRQVRPAGADVAAKHVTAVALIVHPDCQRHALVGNSGRISEDVDSQATNWRQEHFQIWARHQLWGFTQYNLSAAEPAGYLWQLMQQLAYELLQYKLLYNCTLDCKQCVQPVQLLPELTTTH